MFKRILEISRSYTEKELDWIYHIVRSIPSKGLALEVGLQEGISTAVIYLGLDAQSSFITIDTGAITVDKFDTFVTTVKNTTGRYPIPFAVESLGFLFLRSSSRDASYLFKNNSIDFLYYGDTTCLDEDLETWLPKIRPGGIVAGHNYHIMYPSVVLMTNKWFIRKELKIVDTLWSV